jgi:NlpC/P60 family putative phage cell wall peptidase
VNNTREKIVAEAQSWLGTKWHHEGRVKGAGVDCAQFLIGVYVAAGLVPEFQTSHYPPDWHLHRDERRFLSYLLQYAVPVGADDTPQPGDIVMFRYGRHAAHGSIVIGWPVIIHAWRDVGAVTLTDVSVSPLGAYRLKGLT